MSPRRLAEGFTRLRDRFSVRDLPRKKWSTPEQSSSSNRADAQVQPQPQSRQFSPTAVLSTATTTTPSNDETAQTEANEEETQSEEKSSSKADLWDKALANINEPEHDRRIVAVIKTFAENPIGDDATTNGRPNTTKDLAKDISERMAKAIQDGREGREQREWQVTIGHKEYSTRGLVEKTVDILNKFVGVGDVAVSFDPVHAALPWAAIRFVLVTLTASGELRSQIVFGLAKVTSLILQCDTYRRVYIASDSTLQPPAEILEVLEASVVQTYTKSLLFLGFAYQRQQSKMAMASAPFRVSEAESYIESLQESGNQLSQAADYCEKHCSLQNRMGIKELLKCAQESRQVMETQTGLILDIRQRMAFDKLMTAEGAAYDSYANQRDARCHPQTRRDLLAQIHEWASDPDSECIYWLQGMAGTGKSTISRTIAHELSHKEVLGASFFFKRGEGDRGKASRFFPTIATQLVNRLPSLAPHIQNAIEIDSFISERAISKQFENLIRLPLTKLLSNPQSPRTVVIVVDALDECDQKQDIQAIVSLLPEVKRVASVRLKFFVTSRPEIPVYVQFRRMRERYKDFVLHLVDERTVEHDITAYLSSELEKIRDDYNIYPSGGQPLPEAWPSPMEVSGLVKMAIPLFIFAATACQLIQNGKHGDPEESLDRILKRTRGTQISKLNELYLFVLEQLLDDPDGSGEELSKRFQEIVGTIVVLADPLSAACLGQILDISEKRIRHMVSLLPSVLYMPSEGSAPIKPLHLSFRDFLVNRNKHKTDQFWVDETKTHKKLAVKCLQLLMNHGYLKKDMCDLQTPGVLRSDIDKGKIDDRLPSEAQYACLYWVYHLKESHESVKDIDQVHEFLKVHFLHWLEALSLMGRISESIELIDELESIVDAKRGAIVLSFLRDAKRFALSFRRIVDTAPLQLYASAIVFAPTQSIVRQTFERYLPEWISLRPHVDLDWNAVLQTLEGHTKPVHSVVFSNDSTLITSGSSDNTIKIWNVAMGEEEQTLEGHTDSVWSVVFSNDSTLIASGSSDKTIKIWNVATGKEEQTLKGHTDSVNSVVFSNDGTLIASGSSDNTIKIWNIAMGKEEQTLEGHTDSVSSVVFSNDSTLIASRSNDDTIKIWNVVTGEEEQTLEDDMRSVKSVVFSNDSTVIASGSDDNTIKIWNVAIGEEEQTLEGHTDSVNSVVFSNDSTLIASGSDDKTIKIWDVATGEEEQTLEGHTDWVTSVVFSNNDTLIASGSCDNNIKIWNIVTGKEEQTLKGHTDSVWSVVFSNDSTLIASGSSDNTIKIWNVATGEEEQTLEGHTDWVTSVVFSSDGRLIASGSSDNTIKIWNVATGEEEQTLEGHTDWVTSVVFSSDSRLIASGSDDKTIRIWSVATGEEEQTLGGHTDYVNSVVFSNDDMLIASGSSDDTIKIWNVATGEEEQTLEGHISFLSSVVFSNDGTLIASDSWDGTINIWNVTTGEKEQTLEGHTDWVKSVVFSNNGTLIASGSDDKTIKIWNVATGEEEQTLGGHTDSVNSVVFSNDDMLITSGSRDKTIKIWNVMMGEEAQTLENHTDSVSSVVFSNDGTLIASGSDDKTIKIWNVATGKEEQTLEGHINFVKSVVFSNNGTLIASRSYDKTIKIWDVATGEEEQTLKGHTDSVNSIVFSNDDILIASGSSDNTIKIWNIAMGKEEQTLEGHTDSVWSVVFSNDETLIASGSSDNTIKIWNVAMGEEEQTLEGHTDSVWSVVFSNDSTLIASGSSDNTIKIWNVATGEEEQTLEGHINFVDSVVFSNDGTLIASGSSDRTIKIWNVATGINVTSFYTDPSTKVLSFTADDLVLVTSIGRFSLETRDASMPHLSKRDPEPGILGVQGEVDGRLGFGISHDVSWITAGGPDGRKVLWLPADFRPNISATLTKPFGSIVVIGCGSGRVVIMGFRWSSFLDEV